MEQASWPMLLPEVSFLLNNVHNASTKLSPHMLTFGREPKAPNDVRPFAGSEGIEGPEAYLEELNRTKEILSELARSNRGRSSIASKAHYDLGKRDVGYKAGDTVLLRKEVRGPLDCRYEGPYTILCRTGENVKISLPNKDKWVHLNRCKPYGKSKLTIPVLTQAEEDIESRAGGTYTNEDSGLAAEGESDLTPSQPPEHSDDLQPEIARDEGIEPERRYPRRNRKPPQLYGDFVSGYNIPTTH